jgi:hypothetical protein
MESERTYFIKLNSTFMMQNFLLFSPVMSLTKLSLAGNNLIIPGQGEFG